MKTLRQLDASHKLEWIMGVGAIVILGAMLGAGLEETFDRFDFLPGVFVDFSTIYLEQGRLLSSDPGALHPKWLYPPLLAVVFGVLARIPQPVAYGIWLGVQLSLTAFLLRLCRQELASSLSGSHWLGAAGLVVASLPVIHCIKWGQISLLVAVGSVWALKRTGPFSAPLMGLLTGMKVYPLAYLIPAVLRREWRLIVHTLGWAAAFGVLIPLVVLGENTEPFLRRFLQAVDDLITRGTVPSQQSFAGAIDMWFDSRAHFGVEQDGPWLVTLPRVVRIALTLTLSGAIVTGTLWRTRLRSAHDPVTVAMILLAVTLATGPGWHHYFCFLPFALAVAIGRARDRKVVIGLVASSWAVTALPVTFLLVRPSLFHWYSSLCGTTVSAFLAWCALWFVADVKRAR